MIVRLEVSASEKVAARSQFEPNGYSCTVAVENLEIHDPEELLGQARTLFRRAKEAIKTAQRDDGLGEAKVVEEPRDSQVRAPRNGEHAPSPKQRDLIVSLAKRAGMDESRLREFSTHAVGGPVEQLTKFDASRLISALQAPVAANGNGRAR